MEYSDLLELSHAPSEEFLLDTISNLRARCQSYVIEVETAKAQLEQEQLMNEQRILRLEEENETQNALIKTLQQQLRIYKLKYDDSTEKDIQNQISLLDTVCKSNCVQTDDVLTENRCTQTGNEIFTRVNAINSTLCFRPAVQTGSSTPRSTPRKLSTPRSASMQTFKDITLKNDFPSFTITTFVPAKQSAEEAALTDLYAQIDLMKKSIPIDNLMAFKDLLVRADNELKSLNATYNWKLLAKLFRLQLVLYTIEVDDEYISFDFQKRENLIKVVNSRIIKILIDRSISREKYKLMREKTYENWMLAIVETLKHHSDLSTASLSTHRTMEPKYQLKLALENFTKLQQTNTMDHNCGDGSNLSQREKFKVNTIAPVFAHNFAEMTVKDRKKVLCEFIEYVHRGNLDGMGVEQFVQSRPESRNQRAESPNRSRIKVFIPSLSITTEESALTRPMSARPSSAKPNKPSKSPPSGRAKRKYKIKKR